MLETIVFDIFIKIMIYSSWIGIFLAPTTLLGLRIFHFFTDKTSIFKERLLTLLLPFSIGVEDLKKSIVSFSLYSLPSSYSLHSLASIC